MNRVDRLFGILILLQSKKYVTADKIAEKFGISARTVYRDIKAIYELGIPVSFEQHKGYFIMQGYFLPPVSFTSEEANALLLMESIVYSLTDKSIQKHYTSALQKIKAVLKSSEKEKVEQLADTVLMQVPTYITQDFDYLSALQQAISTKTIVELDYKNNNEETSQRRVECIGLIFYAFNWHLIAWCHKRQAYRDFRASRILRLKNTGLPFCKTDHIELNSYFKALPVCY